MFKSLHPFYSIDNSDNTYWEWKNEYIRDPFYYPTSTCAKLASKESIHSYILMNFIDHNGRMDLVAKSIEAESAGYCPYDKFQNRIKQNRFELKIINSQSDIKLLGDPIKCYAIDSLVNYNNSRVFFKGLTEYKDINKIRHMQLKLFLDNRDFDILFHTCAIGIPPFIRLDFSSSEVISFNDLDDDCSIFENDVDFHNILKMSIDIEYAYDHSENLTERPRGFFNKIFQK